MEHEPLADNAYPRFLTRGRAFVYVLPCREQDLLKIGFSRDPLQRLHTLHRRFPDFFDLERALLVETDSVREARGIERALLGRFATARASAPLAVRDVAGGRNEWFAGVAAQVDAAARAIAATQGWQVHVPMKTWLRERFVQSRDVLHGWSGHMLEAIAYEHFNPPAAGLPDQRPAVALRAALDVLVAVDLDVRSVLPPEVVDWYHYGALPASR